MIFFTQFWCDTSKCALKQGDGNIATEPKRPTKNLPQDMLQINRHWLNLAKGEIWL